MALSVFPQLDALTRDARMDAVAHILEVFHPKTRGKPTKAILMRRIEAAADGENAELSYDSSSATEPTYFDPDGDNTLSVAEFLVAELCQQYRGTDEAKAFRDMLEELERDGESQQQ